MQRSGLHIVFEDRDILVANKPPGLLTSTGPREKRPTLLAAVQNYVYEKEPRARVGLIHRLDRDASGLLIFSKNPTAYYALKRQFFQHSVLRVYSALLHGTPQPASGTIETWLIERADGTVYSSRDRRRGQQAISHYKTLNTFSGKSLVEVTLETGKKHQIRVHLSERGWPIVNDPMYGSKTAAGPMRLVAVALEIDHPRGGNRTRFAIQPPPQMLRPT